MSQLVVLQIKSPPAKIAGQAQRVLLEIAPGLFTGKMSKPGIRKLWDDVCKTSCQAMCVVSAKCECGFEIWSHGEGNRTVCDNYGVPLIKYTKSKTAKKEPD